MKPKVWSGMAYAESALNGDQMLCNNEKTFQVFFLLVVLQMSRHASISVLEPREGTLLAARRNAQESESDWARLNLRVTVRDRSVGHHIPLVVAIGQSTLY